jgi:hypothetical protein
MRINRFVLRATSSGIVLLRSHMTVNTLEAVAESGAMLVQVQVQSITVTKVINISGPVRILGRGSLITSGGSSCT